MQVPDSTTRPLAVPPTDPAEHPIVLFDGVCNLCNAAVNFIIDHDPEAVFRFAPLQSETGRRWTQRCGLEDEDTVILVEGGRCYARSTAALRIARRLSGAWPLLAVFLAVPVPIRDAVYRFISRHRFEWFGKRDACRLPTPELRSRFLAYDAA